MLWLQLLLLFTCTTSQPAARDARAAEGTALFARDKVITVANWQIRGDLGIEAATPSGDKLEVAANDAMLLDAGIAALPSRRARVLLRNGESITAELTGGGRGRQWAFTSPLWGSLELEEAQIAMYEATPVSLAKEHPAPPFILLRNGDVIAAAVEQVGQGQVTVNTEFGQTQIPLETVSAIVWSAEAPPLDGRGPRQFLVELADGQLVHCDTIGEADGRLLLGRAGAQSRVERSTVTRIVWPAATLAHLSEGPVQGEGRSYFGQPIAPLKDRNGLGGPLRIDNRWFTRGLGMRSGCRSMFPLTGSWTYLAGYVGLDPWLGRRGHCEIAVIVGGREACREILQGGQPGLRLMVPVSGAKEIELRVEFGPGGDLGDYVNWCDLLLVGERGKAGKP